MRQVLFPIALAGLALLLGGLAASLPLAHMLLVVLLLIIFTVSFIKPDWAL